MSGITVRNGYELEAGEWDRFVDSAFNGTMFHRQDFLGYHPPGRFAFEHLAFLRGARLVALLPGGVVQGEYRSPLGASFGGFVFPPSLPFRDADAVVKCFLLWCRTREVREVRLTPPMQVYSPGCDEVFENALVYNRFVQYNPLYSSVIDLGRIRSAADLAKTPRYCVNHARRKGVVIAEDEAYGESYAMLVRTKEKFRAVPTHTLQELELLRERLPGRLVLFGARFEGRLIAAQHLFLANRNCALIFYSMHDHEYRGLHAVNLLVEHSIRWCAQRGMRYLDFGVSCDTFSPDPLEPSWSLLAFKESMGCTGALRRTYRLALS